MNELKFICIDVDFKYLSITIIDQSHIGNNFGLFSQNYFRASNGMTLCSISHPQYASYDTVYVRGTAQNENGNLIKFPNALMFSKFIDAVEEYNIMFHSKLVLPKELFEID